jgi:hypothetical protein
MVADMVVLLRLTSVRNSALLVCSACTGKKMKRRMSMIQLCETMLRRYWMLKANFWFLKHTPRHVWTFRYRINRFPLFYLEADRHPLLQAA